MADQNKSNEQPLGGGTEDRTIIRSADTSSEEHTPSRPQYKPPYLVIVDGPRSGAHFPLSEGENIIGRAPGSIIRLDDQSVSRQHSQISKSVSGWIVKDLGSKNGTEVNGRFVTDSVVLGHKDVIRVGIYQLRLITKEVSAEEEMEMPKELVTSDRTVFVSAPPDGQTAQMEEKEVAEQEGDNYAEGADEPENREALHIGEVEAMPEGTIKKLGSRQLVMIGALALVAMATAAFFGHRMFFKSKADKAATAQVDEGVAEQAPPAEIPEGLPTPDSPMPPPDQTGAAMQGQVPPSGALPAASQLAKAGEGPPIPPQPGVPGAPQPATPPQATTQAEQAPSIPTLPIFLDFASSPMSATVKFNGEVLGKTPLRVNVQIEPDRTYQAEATFELPELNQTFNQIAEFKAEKDTTVVPIHFKGPIGVLKVNDLPRDVEFYLEGKYSFDKFQEKSAKLTEIVLQKPIYIPYGEYILELRKTRKLGETSETFVSDIVFKRDFVIAEETPSYETEVKDGDLSIFPVKIRTEPENAEVFIDGKKAGKSPFEGNFPLGEHRLSVQKEGYFEHSENLKVDINTPFIANIKLKTSIAGAHLNNAKLAMDRQMYQEAINELAEALNSAPAPSEVARANYMLGVSYLKLNDVQRAISYFDQSKSNEELKYAAMLGMANCYALMERLDMALPTLVEVMLKNKDENVKRDANALFQKISPFKSVIYIYSDPQGADVVVNDKLVGQKTPVILHEIPLGNYRIHIEKPGFIPTDLTLTLSVNEFNPVIVKLKPIPR